MVSQPQHRVGVTAVRQVGSGVYQFGSPCSDTTALHNYIMVSQPQHRVGVTTVRQVGVVCVSLGVLVLILQPSITISW